MDQAKHAEQKALAERAVDITKKVIQACDALPSLEQSREYQLFNQALIQLTELIETAQATDQKVSELERLGNAVLALYRGSMN